MPAKINRYAPKFIALLLILAGIWFLGMILKLDFSLLEERFRNFPVVASAPIFVFSYVVLTFFFWFSKDGLRIVAAALFGAYLSTLLILVSELLNCLVLFSLSRSLGRKFVEERLGSPVGKLDRRITDLSFGWLVLFRMAPLIPFRFFDLAAGLTGLSLRRYFLACVLGSPLRIFWVQFILAGVGQAIFTSPQVVTDYLMRHEWIFVASLLYCFLIAVVIFKMRKGENKCQ